MLETATAVATLVGPFLPWLVTIGQGVAGKLQDKLAEKGGDAAWALAQKVWTRVKEQFAGDAQVESAANLAATDPDDADLQKTFASILAKRLQANPDFEKELVAMLGGREAVQEILAGNNAWIENNEQTMEGTGKQRIEAKDHAVIRGNKQRQGGGSE